MLLDLLPKPLRPRDEPSPPVGHRTSSPPRSFPDWQDAPLIVTPEPDGRFRSYCSGCGSAAMAATHAEVMPWWLRHVCQEAA